MGPVTADRIASQEEPENENGNHLGLGVRWGCCCFVFPFRAFTLSVCFFQSTDKLSLMVSEWFT